MGEDLKSIPRSQARTVGPLHQKDKNVSESKIISVYLPFQYIFQALSKKNKKEKITLIMRVLSFFIFFTTSVCVLDMAF